MAIDRYGYYKAKDQSGYIAHDTGDTFVHSFAHSVSDGLQAERLTNLANEHLWLLKASRWERLKWAIRVQLIDGDPS